LLTWTDPVLPLAVPLQVLVIAVPPATLNVTRHPRTAWSARTVTVPTKPPGQAFDVW
jgi:hypothetical protein